MADRATWVKRVAAWRASGLTASKFCEGRDFAVGTLHWWSSRLGTRRETAPTTIRMARVVRRAASAGVTTAVSGGSLVVEIGTARVAVATGFDRETLTCLLDVLESRGRGGGR